MIAILEKDRAVTKYTESYGMYLALNLIFSPTNDIAKNVSETTIGGVLHQGNE